MQKRIVAFIFLVIIAAMAMGELSPNKAGFSPMENRYLAVMPGASWRTIRTGEWMDDLETYMADHVLLRDQWIRIKNTLERFSGRSQIDSVCFAEEDRLIQVQNVSLDQLSTNMQAIGQWVRNLPEDLPVSFLMAPTSSWIYQDQLPPYTMTYDPQQASEAVRQALPERVTLVNPYEVLYEHRDEAIYFKSDHHWTMRGAAYAFTQLAAALHLEVDPFAYEEQKMGTDFRGSVYSQAPVFGYSGEDVWVYQTPGLKATWEAEGAGGTLLMEERFAEKDQYTAFLGGNYGVTHIMNPEASREEAVLVLKDSYANILMPFLAEQYQNIYMVDLRYYREDLSAFMEKQAIEQVICIYNLDFLCTDQNFVWLNFLGGKEAVQ